MRILIVEDNKDFLHLICSLIRNSHYNATIHEAETLEDAIPHIPNVDIVITDFNFPSEGFPALLPHLQKENKSFILQSSCQTCIDKTYDHNLQIAAIYKGFNFTSKLIKLLNEISVRFNNVPTG
jgi:CheY-like chemotaxis protein